MSKVTIVSYAYRAPTALYAKIKRKNALAGGAEIFLDEFIRLLHDYDREVTVIQGGLENKTETHKGLTLRTVRVPSLVRSLGIPEQWWGFNWAWPKALDSRPGHIHLHHAQHAWPGAPETATATFHGVTWDIPTATMKAYIPSRFAGLLQNGYTSGEKFLTRHAIRHLSRIASVDSFLKRYVQSELPDHRNKVHLIPNFVDTNAFHPRVSGTSIRKKYGDRPLILFPRNLSFSRGVQFLPDAIKLVRHSFPDALFLVVGDGNGREWLEKQITQEQLRSHIELLGHIAHDDLPPYYAAADVVIIPTSHFEGTSLSALEAMATGRPLVVTDVGGLLDLVEDNQSGLVIQPDGIALGQAIQRLLSDTKLAQRLGATAHDRAVKNFSLERWRTAYAQFLGLEDSSSRITS